LINVVAEEFLRNALVDATERSADEEKTKSERVGEGRLSAVRGFSWIVGAVCF